MSTIIIPASHEQGMDKPIEISRKEKIQITWLWKNVENVGLGWGSVDCWIELRRQIGWTEGGLRPKDSVWLRYEPGKESNNGLSDIGIWGGGVEAQEFAEIGGVEVSPGLGGHYIPPGAGLYDARWTLTIPGPQYSSKAKEFWERRLGGAYFGYTPTQKFHLKVRLYAIERPNGSYRGQYAQLLGEHEWEDLFEVQG